MTHQRANSWHMQARDVIVAAVLCAIAGGAQAYPGGLDTMFGTGGIAMTAIPPTTTAASGNAVALQNDGKFVMGGASGVGTAANFAVARFHPNGTLDTSYNGIGYITTAVSAS